MLKKKPKQLSLFSPQADIDDDLSVMADHERVGELDHLYSYMVSKYSQIYF